MSNSYELPTYWKQADDGLTAHVYEHIIARYVEAYMFAHKCLLLTDYDMWAKTYGRTCFFETRFQNERAKKHFKKALDSVDTLTITSMMMDNAVQECAIEYRRPALKVHENFSEVLNQLNAVQWNTIENFTYDKAEALSSVNTQFKNMYARFAARSARKFEEIIVEYEIDETVFTDSPALKALAVLVIQTIALNQSALIAPQLHIYDDGDEWDEGADRVAYRTHVIFNMGQTPSKLEFKKLFDANRATMMKDGLSDKLQQLIQHNYSNESQQYFSGQVMNSITGGLVLGGAGWRQIATPKNIDLVLSNLKVNFL